MATRSLPTELRPVGIAARIRGRPGAIAVIGLVVLAISLVAGVTVGSIQIGVPDTLGVILQRTFGLDLGGHWTAATETIVWELRMPRVLTAALVGAGLAVAGATFQGIVRNPLADPYVLGTSSGAALGAALAIILPIGLTVFQFGLVNIWAFIGALSASLLVFRLGGAGGPGGMTRLLLTGYAVGSILAALLTMAMYVSGANLRAIFSFLLGGLAAASWERLLIAAPIILTTCLLVGLRARSLDGLLLGDPAASHLGVDVKRERGILLVLATMTTAAAVAITGLIGFVGLVVPHVVRLLVGAPARRVVPLSAIFGAILLVLADLVARLLGDLPVGRRDGDPRRPVLPGPAPPDPLGVRAVTAILAADNVTVAYGDRTILADVSLSMRAGERVALVGPNGAGKSTLLRVLTGVLEPRAGDVTLRGEAIGTLDRKAVAREIAVVPELVQVPFAMTRRARSSGSGGCRTIRP